ncbi:2-amino-4-hydroxy-6-hydroxymethyldihydropteridine diphosphokinase [Prochlorococcus marinus]|uniref:2-amino-4-hydroxy-6- hydroxymethyldihydropteridine diphosphokinase n=1 Tax=Prochlorococcus marinus TaxID=1219 RepID=UPI001ADC3AFE|nr:2-amino-4-hydroxy-6-hydroxymethyldihydropteridine diphosphokinase [Prochlorococcus marinus CUG1415]MBW3043162.1 2-amino-4-hydroxy-6-hydroxymethyldihydropteridine diphosphokinase [Prochlorococcus marinus str. MU1415]
MELSNLNIKNGLCISLGANIDSKFGSPLESFLLCKPKLEEIIKVWGDESNTKHEENKKSKASFLWSSIYETSPHGVEHEQPNYLNTLVLVKSNDFPKPSTKNAKLLLKKLKKLEYFFGREKTPRGEKWLSRCLDLDILWWEDLHTIDEELALPHPRFMNRNFVITPLSEILSRSQKINKFDNQRWSIT